MIKRKNGLNYKNIKKYGKNPTKELSDKLISALPERLSHNSVIVDYGCGSGRFEGILLKFAKTLYCIDINKDVLMDVKSRFPSAITIEDTRTIPSSSVDFVLLANSFHDFDDKQAAVAEINRVLRSTGRIIVIDFEKMKTQFGPPISIRMNKEDYLRYFYGFRIFREFKPAESHYGLVIVRKG